jgi:hypothetical protein
VIHIAVHRHENIVWYKPLSTEEYGLLAALIEGKALGDAIDLALTDSSLPEDQRPAFLQEAFATWSMLGWFTT